MYQASEPGIPFVTSVQNLNRWTVNRDRLVAIICNISFGVGYCLQFDENDEVKRYTKNSDKTVIATVHQPLSEIFHEFDNILLLVKGQVIWLILYVL